MGGAAEAAESPVPVLPSLKGGLADHRLVRIPFAAMTSSTVTSTREREGPRRRLALPGDVTSLSLSLRIYVPHEGGVDDPSYRRTLGT